MKISIRLLTIMLAVTLAALCQPIPSLSQSIDERLHLENGWFVHGDRIVWGYAQHNGWWRAGTRPNITRNAPGDARPNRTEDLDRLTDNMLRFGYPGFEHNFGLWYDRRRDAHDTARRDTPDVQPPFLEQPWARSGEGKAWDGLSKYDLTKYNTWYFERVKEFADRCSHKGAILFFNFYMQHALLETNAHYVDFPWRPDNCIQDTGMPTQTPAANIFYDVSDPTRRRLHQAYIRKCLNELGAYPNVVFLLSEEYTGPLSFMEFWLDTVSEWEKANERKVKVALGGTKDVLDALADDPRVSVLDLRYWWYKTDGSLYAPPSGKQIPGRYVSGGNSSRTSPGQIYRQVREYRKRYPRKGIVHSIDATREQTLAFLMGGGSMLLRYLQYPDEQDPPDYIPPKDSAIIQPLYTFINKELAASLQKTSPVDLVLDAPERNWCLADPNRLYLVYALEGGEVKLDLTDAPGSFHVQWFDPRTGERRKANPSLLDGGKIVSFNALNKQDWLLWLDAAK